MLPSPTKLSRLGHFPPASQAGRLAGPVFYVYVFSLFDLVEFLAWLVFLLVEKMVATTRKKRMKLNTMRRRTGR